MASSGTKPTTRNVDNITRFVGRPALSTIVLVPEGGKAGRAGVAVAGDDQTTLGFFGIIRASVRRV